ncbi:MAG: HAMP domain-containing histidine kinase [Nitrosopumilus sp.]|nr:HAMP domain-containing histidine kinase [Nitrosopumilus sp.]
MPIFLDMHELGDYTKEQLVAGLEDDADEFGVLVHQMLFNEKENILHCICTAPDVAAIEKHHEKFNVKCKKIIPIDQIKTDKVIKEEKLKTVGELSSRLSHDIRNPLTILQTSLDVLRSNNPETYEKDIARFNTMYDAIKRIDHQISDVLGFLGTRKLNFTETDLSDILNSSIEGIKIPTQIVVEMPQNKISLNCDFESMRTVFSNIILNAIQAMNDTGKIIIKALKKEDSISISFENSGPAIPEKIISKIFDTLFTTKQEGTGLGLVSCKNIVEQHGGKIEIKNNPTTFTVILPQKIK